MFKWFSSLIQLCSIQARFLSWFLNWDWARSNSTQLSQLWDILRWHFMSSFWTIIYRTTLKRVLIVSITISNRWIWLSLIKDRSLWYLVRKNKIWLLKKTITSYWTIPYLSYILYVIWQGGTWAASFGKSPMGWSMWFTWFSTTIILPIISKD